MVCFAPRDTSLQSQEALRNNPSFLKSCAYRENVKNESQTRFWGGNGIIKALFAIK